MILHWLTGSTARRIQVLIVVLFSNGIFAAETCCVDEDIAAAFPQALTYSRDWPAGFPIELAIEGVEYIASASSPDRGFLMAAWRSEMDEQATRDLVTDAVLAGDWVPMPDSDHPRFGSERGFIPHQARPVADNQQFCRDRDGTLTVQTRPSSIGTVVTLAHSASQKGRDCAELVAARSIHQGREGGVMAYLPALSLPETIDARPGGGTGSSGDEAHASMSVRTSVSAADVSFHFEPQMKSQQWTLDSDIQGSGVTGHVWRRNVDDLNLVCIVTVFTTSNGLLLRMHMEAL